MLNLLGRWCHDCAECGFDVNLTICLIGFPLGVGKRGSPCEPMCCAAKCLTD